MSARIEAWIYSSGSSTVLGGAQTLQLKDTGGWVELTLAAPTPLSSALAEWQSAANASGGLSRTDYAFSLDTSTGLVTLAAGAAFDYRLFPGTNTLNIGLARALGFSTGTGSGSATYTSDTTPTACLIAAVGYDAPRSIGPTDLRAFRWGRNYASAWHAAKETTVTAVVSGALTATWPSSGAAFNHGPLFVGRMRLYPVGYVSGAYSFSNPRGYLDVYPVGDLEVRPFGDGSESAHIVTTRAVMA